MRYFDGLEWTSQYTQLPPPPQPPKSGGGGRKALIGGLAAVAFIVMVNVSGNDDKTDSTTSTTTRSASVATSRVTPVNTTTTKPIPPPGSAVRDGKFEFRVLGITQQETITDDSGYLSETAQGVYYVVTLSVTNIGDEARSYYGGNQKLIDASGREYEADSAVDYYLNEDFSTDINPGNSIQVKVAFDVPPGTAQSMLELHDSMFSGGAKVRL
jgi:hypothetical protein